MGMEGYNRAENEYTENDPKRAEAMAWAGDSFETAAAGFEKMTDEEFAKHVHMENATLEEIQAKKELYIGKSQQNADLAEVTARNKFDRGE